MTGTARLTGHVPKAVLDETEQLILAETDFRREADSIDFFREHLRLLGYVTVPEAYREYSSDRVLTMSLLGGEHLETCIARRPSQRERDKLGTHLFELFYYQLLEVEALHADPHWGNYLFGANGTIGLADFGCVKHWAHKFVENLRAVFLYPVDRQSAEFQRLLAQRHPPHGTGMRPAAQRALANLVNGFYRRVYPPEPEKDSEPFDFGEETFLSDYMREGAQPIPREGCAAEAYFMVRAEAGLYQTLHRLQSGR